MKSSDPLKPDHSKAMANTFSKRAPEPKKGAPPNTEEGRADASGSASTATSMQPIGSGSEPGAINLPVAGG
eukprot:3921350-Pyramimonas_sp.AAC.1